MAALAQMTQTTVYPNHSGWDSAGRYTPHQIQFSRTPCKCGVENALLRLDYNLDITEGRAALDSGGLLSWLDNDHVSDLKFGLAVEHTSQV